MNCGMLCHDAMIHEAKKKKVAKSKKKENYRRAFSQYTCREDRREDISASRSYACLLLRLLGPTLALLLLLRDAEWLSPLSLLRSTASSTTSVMSSSCFSSAMLWSSQMCLIRALTSPQTVTASAWREQSTQVYCPSALSR
jgi:hypothetical protein